MMVMMMAMTPSLKASSRVLPMYVWNSWWRSEASNEALEVRQHLAVDRGSVYGPVTGMASWPLVRHAE
jgi:hypothetical protein